MESITGRLFVGGAFLPKRMLFFRFCLKKVDYSRIYIEKNIDSDKIYSVYMLYLLRKEKNMDSVPVDKRSTTDDHIRNCKLTTEDYPVFART